MKRLAAPLALLALTLSLVFGFSPAPARATITMPGEANTANVVLVVRFSDETTQNGYNETPTGSSKTAWASTAADFNSAFKNYIATATRGKLNVQSLFPQSAADNATVAYLTIDMTKEQWTSTQALGLDVADSAIVNATAKAFNEAYPNWSGSQANIAGNDDYIDNTMILVDTELSVTEVRSNSNYYPGLDSANSATLGGVKVGGIEVIHAARAGRGIAGAIDAVPAHEYLHRLGAKDLYRSSENDCELCAGWDMMASARRSLLPLAQTAEDIGALTINEKASTAGTYEFTLGTYLSDDENAPHAVKIKSPKNDSEYFVLEYRQGDLETFNGYKADVYMGGKLSSDTSGAYNGVIISRVNPVYRNDGNKEYDYLYVFRPGDTAETSKGGDGKTNTYKNANIKAGASFGNTSVSAGIADNALCYSDGTNSRIVVEVENISDGKAKVKVTIPDYSDEDAWTAVKNSAGETTFSAGTSASSVSLALSNGLLWGAVSGYATTSVVSSDGDTWSSESGAADSLVGVSVIDYDGCPVVAGVSKDYKSAVVRVLINGAWVERSVKASSSFYDAKAAAYDGKLYLLVNDGTTVTLYDASSDAVSQVGAAVNANLVFSYAMIDATHLLVADGGSAPAALKLYELQSGSWTSAQSSSFSARAVSVATVGAKRLLLAESARFNVAGKLFDVSNGTLSELSFNVLTGTETATLSSDGSSFYIVRCNNSTVNVYTSKDGTSWTTLGDEISNIGCASGAVFLNGKAFLVTASQTGGSASLRYHESAAAEGFYDVSMFKNGSDSSAWTHPTKDGYAFAGWYAGETCEAAYTGTTGYAYARFVPVSELISYTGAGLRDELKATYGYDRTTLRFCYAFSAPSGSTSASASWWWKNGKSGLEGETAASSYWLSGGDSMVANLAMAGIRRAGDNSTYQGVYQVRGRLSYTTCDGTPVTAEQAEASKASVEGVASAICSGSCASSAERQYAKEILGSSSSVAVGGAGPNDVTDFLDVSVYKSGNTYTAPTKDGYAFAGWYAGETCEAAYTGTTGYAYARFVPVSELISYTGAGLRDELKATYGYDRTTLRFCYAFSAPSGSTSASASWWWKNGKSGLEGETAASSYWLSGGDSMVANLAMAGIRRAGDNSTYQGVYQVRGRLSYTTCDGTPVTAEQAEASKASVEGVASAICSGSCASSTERAYGSAILGS